MTLYVLISRQLLSPRLPGPRGPLGVRNTKSKVSTFRTSHFQRSTRPASINFVPADFFLLRRKRTVLVVYFYPKITFTSYQSLRTVSWLFCTQTNKVRFMRSKICVYCSSCCKIGDEVYSFVSQYC